MNCAIIPARGGSKRIPKKNIIDFCGKPMIAWSIEAAKKSECFDRIIISTDDDEIAEISIKFKWNSEGIFFIDEEIDPILLAQYSNMMLKENRTDINILGWIEVLESDLELRLLALDSKITYKELSSII